MGITAAESDEDENNKVFKGRPESSPDRNWAAGSSDHITKNLEI
jgi:hypothetical protein